MYSTMCNRLALKHESDNSSNSKVSLKTLDITRQTIEIFIIQFYEGNKDKAIDSNNESASALKYSFQMITILDKHLDWLIDLDTQENFKNISGLKYNKGTINITKSKQTKIPTIKCILDQINFMHCLFTWNLQTSYSKKDIISHVKKKYGNYNLDISLPVFTFERYISNIIIGFELFHKDEKETAKIILLSIGNWLEELDKSTDDFYLLISDGLKHVLLSTLAHMMRTNLTENIHWFLDFIPFSDISYHSKAAVHAIQAAVLIEYGHNEDFFKKAVECINIACDLDPNIPYWFYIHSLVLRAHRQFSLTYKSCPTEDERSTIQQAISLSNVQNIYFMYHEITLFKDTILYDFHKNKNEMNKHKMQKEKHLSKEKKIISMIKRLICIEPTDPLILINCVKMLKTLTIIAHDLNFEKKLLLKGLKLAPDDLTVLKAVVVQIIVHCKKTIKNNKSSQDQHLKINERACLGDDLKFAVEKHRIGKDPILHLTSILNNYDSRTQWKILAQICSYTILFNDNLKDGLKIFMMLVEAEENKMIHSDLILHHFSSFADKHKKFNLAQLFCEKIVVELSYNNDNYEEQFYRNQLHKIVLKYDIDINTNRSMKYNLINEINNRKSRNKHLSKNNVNYNSNIDNTNTNEDDDNYEDVNSDDSIYSVTIVDSNDGNDHNNNDDCCLCRIM